LWSARSQCAGSERPVGVCGRPYAKGLYFDPKIIFISIPPLKMIFFPLSRHIVCRLLLCTFASILPYFAFILPFYFKFSMFLSTFVPFLSPFFFFVLYFPSFPLPPFVSPPPKKKISSIDISPLGGIFQYIDPCNVP
jgi:hypothetical protein